MKKFYKRYNEAILWIGWFAAMGVAFWLGGFYWYMGVASVGLLGTALVTGGDGGTYG